MAGRGKKAGAALQAGREHLGAKAGDKPNEAAPETAENQDAGGAGAGDKPGEFVRQSYQLTDIQRTALADAREVDGEGEAGKIEEEAFWRAAADRGGFNPATVEEADDFEDTGTFTAYPAEAPAKLDTANNEANQNAALDRFQQIAETADIAAESAAGDIRDAMLDIIKHRPKPWSAHSASEQREMATAIDYAVKTALRRSLELIAAEGRQSISATLERYADKGGEITATIKIQGAEDATILALHSASGKAVVLIAADASAYCGQRRDPDILPDEPELGFNAGSDERPAAPADNSDLAEAGDEVADQEALYQRAITLVREQSNASPSFLQRVLEIGFSDAQSILERMEADGVVSAPDVTTKRAILPWESGDNRQSEASAAAESA